MKGANAGEIVLCTAYTIRSQHRTSAQLIISNLSNAKGKRRCHYAHMHRQRQKDGLQRSICKGLGAYHRRSAANEPIDYSPGRKTEPVLGNLVREMTEVGCIAEFARPAAKNDIDS